MEGESVLRQRCGGCTFGSARGEGGAPQLVKPPARISHFISQAAAPSAVTLTAQMSTSQPTLDIHRRACPRPDSAAIRGSPRRAAPCP